MKNLKDLKSNEAIKVDRWQWVSLGQLISKSGIKHQSGFEYNPFEDNYKNFVFLILNGRGRVEYLDDILTAKIYPASDFQQAEPKFKVGDKAIINDLKCPIQGEVEITSREQHPETDKWAYMVKRGLEGIKISEDLLLPVPQYEIGAEYEFSDGEGWVKGKLAGTVDYEGEKNFIADLGKGKLSVFSDILPIQPIEITKENLSGLLKDWVELWDNDHLHVRSNDYDETLFHLSANTHSILDQLKHQGKC